MTAPSNLKIPSTGRILFLGAGGIGVSALARYFQGRVDQCFALDGKLSPVLESLTREGITVLDEKQALAMDFDCVIYTHAAPPHHPILDAARHKGVPIISRGQVVVDLLSQGKTGIGITGSHGKTTVTFLTAHCLLQGGSDPSILGGGIDACLRTNYRVGRSLWLVAELDESDRTFCTARPQITVITNCDHEHVRSFPRFDDLKDAFRDFLCQLPEHTVCVIGADDPGLDDLASEHFRGRLVRVGTGADADYRIESASMTGADLNIALVAGDTRVPLSCPILGAHHAVNLALAAAAAREAGLSFEAIDAGLRCFRGIERRMEYLKALPEGGALYSDYAHHPTEVRAVLQAARHLPGKHPVLAIFEAHRLSRLSQFLEPFAEALKYADEVWLPEVYTAGETGDGKRMLEQLAARLGRTPVRFVPSARILSELEQGSACARNALLLTAGPLDGLIRGML